MTTIVTRAGKGSPLTNTEMDTNLTNLNTDKLEVTTAASTYAAKGANSDITSLSTVTSISTAAGCDVHGTNTNNSASAGYKGEYVESIVSSYINASTTNQWGDITSITLTAGDWDISALVSASANGATFTTVIGGVGTVIGNSSTGIVTGDTRIDLVSPTGNYNSSGVIPPKRVSLTGSTTYYLKGFATYTIGTPQFAGRISARRAR